ncbi:MAG: hypothetical protein ACLUOI_28775 [Eisenbergiella sp.]
MYALTRKFEGVQAVRKADGKNVTDSAVQSFPEVSTSWDLEKPDVKSPGRR